jgi:hypothetical protein
MGGLSIWHLLIVAAGIAFVWGVARVVWRTGASLLWIIPLYIPFVAPFALVWFSYAKWPKVDRAE